ncbi:zinc finger BED domain-containing protein RICESLEEPER 2-like [Tasmannia lanceolata]|uniref:zinc finger BED domain-containing protein RICESLEEPER 2-like n=1 Tax=Tasmannia lanceolata TaxID=3420 RepID=UPI004063D066
MENKPPFDPSPLRPSPSLSPTKARRAGKEEKDMNPESTADCFYLENTPQSGANNNTANLDTVSSSFKRRKLRSVVWEDFTIIVSEDGSKKAMCKHCKRLFTGNSSSGTTHLKRHLAHCYQRRHLDKSQRILPFAQLVTDKGCWSTSNFKLDQDHCRQELAKMIILHQYPFHMVEDIGFVKFVKSLQPQFKMVTCNNIMGDCLAIFQKEKQKLEEFLKNVPGKISLTSNMWTFNQNVGYMSLTAHFIDNDWKLHKRILNFKIFTMDPSIHLENALTHSISMSLLDWNIKEKLSTITLDNFCNSDTVIEILQENFPEKNMLPLNGQLFCMSCCENILNTIARDELDEIGETIHKVRESVKYVKASHAQQQEFDEIAQQVRVSTKKSLCLDTQSKWNSTYLMLEAALEFREAFCRLETCDHNYKGAPSVDDWNKVEAICMFLKAFYDSKKIFLETEFPASNLYFHELWKIQAQLTQHCTDPDPFISKLAKGMHEKFDKYWKHCSLVLTFAVAMDPRFKMKLLEYCFSKIYGSEAQAHIKLVRDGIYDLYNKYVTQLSSAGMGEGFVDNVNGIDASSDCNDELQEYDKFINEQITNQHAKSELDQYLDEPILPRDQEFDILNWWKLNTAKYNMLSKMARDILAIPMSAVPSELSISTRTKVLDQYRSSLLPETIESLICAQDWLQNTLGGSLSE